MKGKRLCNDTLYFVSVYRMLKGKTVVCALREVTQARPPVLLQAGLTHMLVRIWI